ncbi:MAG: trypsin-like peptidase domain-containing protein [Acidiphilium sp.]
MKQKLAAWMLGLGLALPGWGRAMPTPPPVAKIAHQALGAVVEVQSIDPVKPPHGRPGAVQGAATPRPDGQGGPGHEGPGHGGLVVPPRAEQALGTGFFIDPSGYLVTNHHVIAGASRVTVTLSDGRVYAARRVGVDQQADLAVLKIDVGHKVPYLKFGHSSRLALGDWVVAIGNPFGLGTSVSAGVVSALHRDIGAKPFDDYIQTDAAINRGNSGGPLLDIKGRVIGVDSAIYSPSGGSVGIGFAIPASMVKPVSAQLIAHGAMRRGWLGLRIEHVSAAMQAAWHLTSQHGVVVAGVVAGGPSQGILQPGDVLMAVDGHGLRGTHSFHVAVGEHAVGQKLALRLRRDGAMRDVSVTIGALPHQPGAAKPTAPGVLDSAVVALGVRVRPAPQGVAVVSVVKDGPGAKAGLRAGSKIEAVGADFVTTPDQLRKALVGRRMISLLVADAGAEGPGWLAVRLAPTPTPTPPEAKPKP